MFIGEPHDNHMFMEKEMGQTYESSREIITLLRENNAYLKQLLEFKKKEHRQAVAAQTLHIIVTILPFIVILVIGYFVWQSISHYLEVLNNNVNALKSSYDAMITFFQKLIPDFSKIIPDLNQTWQNIQSWK